MSREFKAVDIQEPREADVIPFIGAERTGAPLPTPPPRIAYVLFHRLNTGAFIKGLVNLISGVAISLKELPAEVQDLVDVDEMMEAVGYTL
ncbi:unnamed protein product [Clonostachys chloroleuca]|uniref:Uncharacterized protein n=1 Tax=Clonostachys chloroleuca TaxID=1926264 RepID=A0AA35Q2E8_9HYPO|nr:unnamed protein product [Clonostachys chloroleuca]